MHLGWSWSRKMIWQKWQMVSLHARCDISPDLERWEQSNWHKQNWAGQNFSYLFSVDKFPPSFLKGSAAPFGSSSLVHFWAIFVLKLIPNTLPRCEKTFRRIHILWQSLRNVKFDRHLCKWHSIKITTTTTTTFLCWRSACELYQISWLKWTIWGLQRKSPM